MTATVPVDSWLPAVRRARDELGCGYFDFLSAVDEGDGFTVVCHVASVAPFGHLALQTRLPAEAPSVTSIGELYAGAAWHERETAEMFGIVFLDGAGAAVERPGLLLPPGFEGHPLRKDHLLQSRQDRPWPGRLEPGESQQDEKPSRRRLRPPGVPAPQTTGTRVER